MPTTATHLDDWRAALGVDSNTIVYASFGELIDTWHNTLNAIIKLLNATTNLTNGQLWIGNATNGYPSMATLTAGAGISITNAAGSITIASAEGTLTSAHIFVGNGSNVPTDVALSGDATIDNTGALAIANDAVTTAKILDANVTTAKIADANVTTAKIADGNVTVAKLATTAKTHFANSITALNLAGGALNDVFIFCPDVACTLVSGFLVYQTASGITATTVSIGKPGNSTYYVNAAATLTGQSQWTKQALTLANTDVAANDSLYCSTAGIGVGGSAMVILSYKVN